MKDSWNRHIQPILDSWQRWDNYSWIWDPFLENYPKLSEEQRVQVEDALVDCAFADNYEDLAIKALGIAETLYSNHLASPRLADLFQKELRKQFGRTDVEHKVFENYILAFSTFEMREASPFIKSTIEHLEKLRQDNVVDERQKWYQFLFRDCCLSLIRLQDEDAMAFFVLLIKHNLRVKALTPNFQGTCQFQTLLANSWRRIGLGGLRSIAQNMQGWHKEELSEVLPMLVWVVESVRYQETQEKQDAIMLIENLGNGVLIT